MSVALPEDWKWVKLGEVCTIHQGYGFPKDFQGMNNGTFPFYKVGDISKNVKAGFKYLELCDNYVDEKILIKLRAKPYPVNTIVFAKIGEALKLNRRAIIKYQGIVDNNAVGLKAIEKLCNDLFLYYFFTTIKLEDYSRATTVPSVRKSDIEEINFPLPPKQVQQQIVARIEELFSEIDKGVEELKAAQAQLKVYRHAVLKWGFEGKLTNENVKDGEFPEGWQIIKIGEVCKCVVPNRDKPKSFSGDIKWITTPNLNENSIKIEYEDITVGLTQEEVKKYNARVIPFDSVIMTCVGTFGLSAIVEKPIVINQQLHAFLKNDLIEPKFLAYCIQHNKAYFESKSTSTTIRYLNKENCNSMPFPLCSLEEQRQIVQKI